MKENKYAVWKDDAGTIETAVIEAGEPCLAPGSMVDSGMIKSLLVGVYDTDTQARAAERILGACT